MNRQGTRLHSRRLLWTPLLLSLATGCAVTPAHIINEEYREVLETRHDSYRLKPGDIIRLESANKDDPTLNQLEILILPDGRTDLFYLNNYRAEGKTIVEVENELRGVVAAQFDLRDVRIQVQPAGEFVDMVGEFEFQPGPSRRVPMTVKMTLQEAIAAVGGMRITGDTDWALLQRPFADPIHPDLFRIDLNDVSEDLYLLPKDRIILGRTALATVIAYIREYVFGIIPTGLWSGLSFAAL